MTKTLFTVALTAVAQAASPAYPAYCRNSEAFSADTKSACELNTNYYWNGYVRSSASVTIGKCVRRGCSTCYNLNIGGCGNPLNYGYVTYASNPACHWYGGYCGYVGYPAGIYAAEAVGTAVAVAAFCPLLAIADVTLATTAIVAGQANYFGSDWAGAGLHNALRAGVDTVGAVGGAVVGGNVGAGVGAAVGSVLGPVGALAGAVIGGVAGAETGGDIGEHVADATTGRFVR